MLPKRPHGQSTADTVSSHQQKRGFPLIDVAKKVVDGIKHLVHKKKKPADNGTNKQANGKGKRDVKSGDVGTTNPQSGTTDPGSAQDSPPSAASPVLGEKTSEKNQKYGGQGQYKGQRKGNQARTVDNLD